MRELAHYRDYRCDGWLRAVWISSLRLKLYRAATSAAVSERR
jgi:hypothetical protein